MALKRLERKLLFIAVRRAQVFGDAQQGFIQAGFRELYNIRGPHASECGLRELLASAAQHVASPQLPDGWGMLIAKLRRFFYESDPHFATREAVKAKGRIHNYAGRRGLRAELDIFNVTSFLRLVLGWTADNANTFAGSVVFPVSHASDTGNAPDTAKKYRQRFKRRFSAVG